MQTKDHSFISVDPSEASLQEVHNLLLGGVTPRPIALVSTISDTGEQNVAPFSFYNAFGANPPYVVFSPAYSGRDGSAKDTLINIRNTPECVVHAVPFEIIQQVSLASTSYAASIDEFVKAGFTALDSDLVQPKRVQESPFHMECIVEQVIPLGGSNGSGNLIICRVVKFHVNQSVISGDIIDPQKIDLVGRNSANFYTRASGDAIFALAKPRGIGIGIDQLPRYIRESHVLSANNLGQLGGASKLPGPTALAAFIKTFGSSHDGELTMDPEKVENYKYLFSKGLSLLASDTSMGKSLIETSAKNALESNDLDFALKALLTIENNIPV